MPMKRTGLPAVFKTFSGREGMLVTGMASNHSPARKEVMAESCSSLQTPQIAVTNFCNFFWHRAPQRLSTSRHLLAQVIASVHKLQHEKQEGSSLTAGPEWHDNKDITISKQ